MIQTSACRNSFNRIWPILFTGHLLFFGCNFRSDKELGKSEQVYASLNDSTHYVGMDACKKCHPAIYETYIQTGMGQSFSTVNRQKSSARFDENSIVSDSVDGYSYHPFWNQDSLFVYEYLISKKDTIHRRREQIHYIVGSGQHTNSHLRNVNGYIYQVPVTYYTQQGKWDLPPGFEGGFNSRFGRKIEMECMSCHNAKPELVQGSENKYINVPNGIDCERCHGPGSKHVADKMAGIIIDTATSIDYSIVNPSKLSIDLQMDVCQRCHIQGNAVLNEGKSFSDFRPGMSLSSVMNVFMPVYKGDPDAHIMASHAERLKMSRCFIVSASAAEKSGSTSGLRPYKNALTCITCHNPHVSVRHTGSDVFNGSCIGCHAGSAINESPGISKQSDQVNCKATVAERSEVKNNCVSCHMPKGGSIDIPHVMTTDHYIRKPIAVSEVEKIREFIGLACINNERVDSITRAKAFISYYEKFSSNAAFLDSAENYLNDRNTSDVRKQFKSLVHWAFLKNDFRRVIQYTETAWGTAGFSGIASPDNVDAWTCYRIGQSYYELGNLTESLRYFTRSVSLAPFKPDFRNKLASVQHDTGKVRDAMENYRFLIHENPDYVPGFTNYGFILLTEANDAEGALKMYDKALALDPLNEQALLNKAGLLIFQNKNSEARILLKILLKRYPSNLKASALYKRLGQTNRLN